MTSGAEMETLTEVSVPPYITSIVKIMKDQVTWCSVHKLQAMNNSAEQMTFNCHAVNGVFLPEYNSKICFYIRRVDKGQIADVMT